MLQGIYVISEAYTTDWKVSVALFL